MKGIYVVLVMLFAFAISCGDGTETKTVYVEGDCDVCDDDDDNDDNDCGSDDDDDTCEQCEECEQPREILCRDTDPYWVQKWCVPTQSNDPGYYTGIQALACEYNTYDDCADIPLVGQRCGTVREYTYCCVFNEDETEVNKYYKKILLDGTTPYTLDEYLTYPECSSQVWLEYGQCFSNGN